LIEQHVFNIVFKIPVPSRIKPKIKYPRWRPLLATQTLDDLDFIKLQNPGMDELPFVNHSHFETLLEFMPNHEDIVRVFTHMLFE
jgi:hypothetical protein